MLRFSLIGAGNLGTNLAYALQKKSYDFVYSLRKSRYKEFHGDICSDPEKLLQASDVVFICTQESRIRQVAREMSEKADPCGKIFFHTSNSLSSDELSLLREKGGITASFSPLQTFNRFDPDTDLFTGVYFLAEGDPRALAIGEKIAKSLHANILKVESVEKKQFHMAAVSSANFLVAILDFAERRLRQTRVGTDISVLLPLVKQTLKNIEKNGVAASLTGPVKRKEFSLIDNHLSLLAGDDARFFSTLSDYLKKNF